MKILSIFIYSFLLISILIIDILLIRIESNYTLNKREKEFLNKYEFEDFHNLKV